MGEDIVIRVQELGKKYIIGHETDRARYMALRDVAAQTARNVWKRALDATRGRAIVRGDTTEAFWALKNVSFEVKRGEVLGIIGRNGAGKSTLLKILSRITEPSEGRVTIAGRVASLLEVGTGFHPELTGRENVYLNGAILGMSRAEIRRKFDQIVAFSGVEKFIDTPVKRYSSGMQVRLAFSVAAHLEPEILVVDEVLAVGDAEFQKKCLGKMEEVSTRDGRTVLFVSHQLSAVGELTNRAILLNAGSIVTDGPTPKTISTYLGKGAKAHAFENLTAVGSTKPYLRRAEVITSSPGGIQQFGSPLTVKFWLSNANAMSRPCFSFQIVNQHRQAVIHAYAYYPDISLRYYDDRTALVCNFPKIRLNVGQYHLRAFLSEPPGGQAYDAVDAFCPFEVVRIDDSIAWGWRQDACVYHEEWNWSMSHDSGDCCADARDVLRVAK
jgi:ABC-type polysaccharide/polyol phosphate transport system ATPase subunit